LEDVHADPKAKRPRGAFVELNTHPEWLGLRDTVAAWRAMRDEPDHHVDDVLVQRRDPCAV